MTMTLDHDGVRALLPHRPPMLLIDTAEELIPGESVTAHWFVDPEREIFKGHFPGSPIVPGVYLIECMAQAADLILLSEEGAAGKLPLFLRCEKAEFRKPVAPGDRVKVTARLAEKKEAYGTALCEAKLYANEKLCATAKVTIALR